MRTVAIKIVGLFVTLFSVFLAPAVFAAEVVPVPQLALLHIDEGFLGHAVTLDLFDGDVRITWDAGDVLAPGDLLVTRTSSTEIAIEWSTSYVLGPRGISVGFAVPTSTSLFDVQTLEAQEPFGDWHPVPAVQISPFSKGLRVVSSAERGQRGFTSARVGAEGSVRLVTSPRGMRQGTATWYRYKKCDCAASPDFPKGTKLLVRSVTNPEKSVVVTVNDFGPDRNLFPSRVIDLDSVAFQKISPLSAGVIRVTVEPVPNL